MLHSDSTSNHRLETWVYADATARGAATGFASSDIGKIAYQQSDGSYWRLTATTPTWAQIGSGGSGLPVGGTAGQILIKQSGVDGDADWGTNDDGDVGIPAGGTTGQVLTKSSNTDYDVGWETPAAGGGGSSQFALDNYLSSSGSARNDEFSSSTLDAKWTLLGTTPDVIDLDTTVPDAMYLKRTDVAAQLTVYYQDLPSLPCSIFTKIIAENASANYCRGGGLILLPATPTTSSKAFYLGPNYNNSNGGKITAGILYATLGTFGSQPFIGLGTSLSTWLRLDILSGGTTVDIYYSINGTFWILGASAVAMGFTVANAGIGFSPEGQALDPQTAFECYRVSA